MVFNVPTRTRDISPEDLHLSCILREERLCHSSPAHVQRLVSHPCFCSTATSSLGRAVLGPCFGLLTPGQRSSVSALWTRQFFVVGFVLCSVGCLAAPLASAHKTAPVGNHCVR